MDLYGLIEQLREDDAFYRVANSSQLQLGTVAKPMIMSRLLPEVMTEENVVRDERMEYKSIIARDASRAQPVTYRKGTRVGRMVVELGDSNTGAQFTGSDYTNLMKILANGGAGSVEQAARNFLQFERTQVSMPLAILREKHRCDAIVNARIIRQGDGDFYDVVDYPNPAGHRFSVPSGTVANPAGWYDINYDLFQDIVGIRDSLITNEGIYISQIITTQKMKSLMNRSRTVQQYGGVISRMAASATSEGFIGSVNNTPQDIALINALAHHNLPAAPGENFWLYDSRYDVENQDGSRSTERFIPDNVFIMLGTTEREAEIELADDVEPLPLYNTLGYTAIGTPLGAATPGVKTGVFTNDRHPPSVDFEGNQTSLPVIQDPDKIVVITIPDPVAA